MNISDCEFKRIKKIIGFTKKNIFDQQIREYSFCEFNNDSLFANHTYINELYKVLDEAITDEEMKEIFDYELETVWRFNNNINMPKLSDKYYPTRVPIYPRLPKIYDQRKNKSQPPLSDHQSGDASR